MLSGCHPEGGTYTYVDPLYVLSPVIQASVPAVGGPTPSYVFFELGDEQWRPKVPGPPLATGGTGPDFGVSFISIEALKADGTHAGNVGWQHSGAAQDQVGTSYLQRQPLGGDDWFDVGGGGLGHPLVVAVQMEALQEAITGFTRDGTDPGFPVRNVIDLGDLGDDPSIELVAEGEAPIGTHLVWEVSLDGQDFEEYSDGDVVGIDVLVGVSPAPAVYYMRVSLIPSPGGIRGPRALRIGARAVAHMDLDGQASVSVTGWSFDPVEMRSEITEAQITLVRDGEADYRDAATELLSSYDLKDLLFSVYIGHPTLPQSDWLLIDRFLVDDYDPFDDRIVFYCLSVHALTRQVLPVGVANLAGDLTQPDLSYEAENLADVYADILDNRVALPGRFRGPGLGPQPWHVTKTFTGETESDAKLELDALARLAAGVSIASQGLIKFVPIDAEAEPVATFPRAEIRAVGNAPGIRQRVPEFVVPWHWDGDRYIGKLRSVHAQALQVYHTATLDAPKQLDDTVARWIEVRELAQHTGQLTTSRLGLGMILLSCVAQYPHPHLELGDPVELETTAFVFKDPVLQRVLRGRLQVRGVVQRIGDVWGREITVWVPSLAPVTRLRAVRAEVSCDPMAVLYWEEDNVESVTISWSERPEPRLDDWPDMDDEVSVPAGVGFYALSHAPVDSLLYVSLLPQGAHQAGRKWRAVITPPRDE
jgi:hypothetical protein